MNTHTKSFSQFVCPKCGEAIVLKSQIEFRYGLMQFIGGCTNCKKVCVVNFGELNEEGKKVIEEKPEWIDKFYLVSNSIILTDEEYISITLGDAFKSLASINSVNKKKK